MFAHVTSMPSFIHLAALLLAAAPAPHAVEHADTVVFTGKLSTLSRLQGFLGPAGERSVLLQPRSYAEDLHPLMLVDPFDAASLESMGMDPGGAATVSRRGNQRFACVGIKDAARFEKAAQVRLEAFGDAGVKKTTSGNLHVATREGTLVAAYVLKGGTSCSWAGGTLTPADVNELARLPEHSSADAQHVLATVPGVVRVMNHGLAFGLDGQGRELKVEGHSTSRASTLVLEASTTSPYAKAKPSGLLFARLRSEPLALVQTFEGQLLPACSACATPAFKEVREQLAQVLSGNALVRVDRVAPGASLGKASGRLAALHFASALELKDVAAGKQWLAKLAQTQPGHELQAGGAELPLDAGALTFNLEGKNLLVSNNAEALAALKDALAGGGGAIQHALDAQLDPGRAAQALRQISLLDVLGNRELAGLFAVGTEMGPLLEASESLSFWAQPRGAQMQFGMSWKLQAATPAPAPTPVH